MKIVLDTNVVISAMLRPHSAAGTLLRMVLAGSLHIAVDERILLEYEEVAGRPELGIDPGAAKAALDRIRARGQQALPCPIGAALPDQDDRPFIEVAHSSAADAIVTGNRKHFPPVATKGIAVLSPQEFLDLLAGEESAVKEGIAVYRGRAGGDLAMAVATEREKRTQKLRRGLGR